ncbi:hypothetical protein F4778DRAFT_229012 [Xylariomycetidae sp. FL2044]|nr:hypothetical protein F4778DRAFT_229012 [Xylariomycetidae sp. FL2044]
MSPPSAFTPPTMTTMYDTSFSSSQGSNPDSSALSFESSFRLESGYPTHGSDCEKHPKGKRKRTTTQDKAILEAAYNSNPKPDKAARLDIVKRVTLNEKEVQIWFQNRRQNDRRKSRPLSPQEIEALRYRGGMNVLSSDPAPTSIDPVPASLGVSDLGDRLPETRVEEQNTSSVDKGPPSPQEPISPMPREEAQPPFTGTTKPVSEASEAGTPPMSQRSDTDGDHHTLPQASSSVGYLSNRWNLASSFSTPSTLDRPGDESFRLDSFPSSAAATADNSPSAVLPPPSTSSQVRLSLSLEGKAELVSSQPSPPHPALQQLPADVETLPPVCTTRTLHRSRSALATITLPPISTLTAHLPPQLARGRSRDVHAWESCCEAETRDELTVQAENESSGSAIAAISLLRSTSSSASLSNLIHSHNGALPNALQPNLGKRNAPPHKSLSRNATKKPRLSRASSSVARLQTLPPVSTVSVAETSDEPEKKTTSKVSLSVILSPSGGDSDKENWSPDSDGNTGSSRRRPLPSAAQPPPPPPPGLSKVLNETVGTNATKTNPRRALGLAQDGGNSSNNNKKRALLGNSTRANTAPVSRPWWQHQR